MAPNTLSLEVTDLIVANTTEETAVFSHSIPGNTLGATGILRFHLTGDYLNNKAKGSALTLRLKFGGTTVYEDDYLASAISARRRPFALSFWLANQNATNDQTGGGYVFVGTAGRGDLNTDPRESATPLIAADTALDTTVAQVFSVTAQWSAANTRLSFRRRSAELTLY